MAGEHADQGLPKLDDEDDEVAESTIAMDSPSFDPVALGVSSPISEPPPAVATPVSAPTVAKPVPGLPSPHTAPVPFTPMGSPAPAVVPTVGRAKLPSSPMVPTPLGGLIPRPVGAESKPSPLAPAAPPVRAGASGAFSGSARARPQTVIGLAPPPPGAPRPGAPARPAPPAEAKADARPPEPNARAAAKPQAPSGNDLPSWAENAKGSRDATSDPGQGLFDLDAGAAEAARAATFTPGPRPGAARPAPASAALPEPAPAPDSLLPSLDTKPPAGGDPEAATVAVPREQLGASPALRPAPQPLPRFDEDDTTQAKRAGLPRLQDAHVVVGDDVGGDDATLAVPLGDKAAKNKQLGAFAQTIAAEGGGFRSSPGAFPVHGHGHGGGPITPAKNVSAPQQGGWNDPHQQWHPAASSSGQMRALGQSHERPSDPSLPSSNPHLMGMPESSSRPGVQYPSRGGPGQMGMPMHQQPMQGQLSHHGQQGAPMMQGQPGQWAVPARGAPRLKISGQLILLAVVGVICLTIFITGIVLFATTKF
ncbi:MAG TPA: hypothetical protein VM925_12655 [Labilithrix sp.]|nr:hypothetical protein [Labilithrix sp.]